MPTGLLLETTRVKQVWLIAGLALAAGVLALLWADQHQSQTGLWLLLGLSVTVGFAHGALDTWLLLVRFKPMANAFWIGAAYLLLVLLLGGLLGLAVPLALLLLLLTSSWHFGEGFARWPSLPAASHLLTRLVVGGAPVMAPLVLKPAGMAALFVQQPVFAEVLPVWQMMAWVWLALAIFWVVRWGWAYRRESRFVWLELAAVLVLNLAFTPLMAFALYFGLYHAPVHIWRVWRGSSFVFDLKSSSLLAVVATLLLTLVLGIGLWIWLSQHQAYPGLAEGFQTHLALALPWLIVSFAAVTLPHLLLIGCCAGWLADTDEVA